MIDEAEKNSVNENQNRADSSSGLLKTSESKAAPSPLPWRADTFAVYDATGFPAAHMGACGRSNKQRIANAELIVHRVNLFPAMVAALQKIYDCGSISEAERVAASALALASTQATSGPQ